MRRLAQALIRLYPASWRERYGEEFETLIEDSRPGFVGTFDLLKGAIRMRLHVPAFPKLALILSLAGLVAGLGVSMLVSPRYVSSAEMQFTYAPLAPSAPRQNLHERLLEMEREILSRTSLSGIIQDPRLDLYLRARDRMPLEDVIEQMRTRDIQIQSLGSGSDYVPFTITFTYPDRLKAQDTVQALVTKFTDINMVMQSTTAQIKQRRSDDQIYRLEARIATLEKRLGVMSPPNQKIEDELPPVIAGINLDVLDVPSLPTTPVYPNRAVFMATGFGAGFALAIVIAVFRRSPPPVPFPPKRHKRQYDECRNCRTSSITSARWNHALSGNRSNASEVIARFCCGRFSRRSPMSKDAR